MRYFEPCLCGADDCPACFPSRAYRTHDALGSLDAEDIEIRNEQAAADEEAERVYQQMQDDARQRAEAWYAAEEAEAAYRDDVPPMTCQYTRVVPLHSESSTYREWDVTVEGIQHSIIDEDGTWTLMVYVPTCLEWVDVPGMDVDTFLRTHRLILAA